MSLLREFSVVMTAALLGSAGCSAIVGSKLDEKDGPGDGSLPGDDSGTPPGGDGSTDLDGGPGADGSESDGQVSDCANAEDGTACGEGRICMGGACASSTCGDGITDARTEECDDENDISGDGCEPVECTFTCSEERSCDDGRACNGTETCDTVSHVCSPGEAQADDTACNADDGSDGRCVMGDCVPTSCGNGMPDEGEECDDGGDTPNDGCEPDCTLTCETDEDCQARDANMCNGAETCAASASGTMICLAGEALDCADDDECTMDSCDAISGCIHDPTPFDMDMDGHSVLSCGGDDCDDAQAAVFGGNQEICLDNLDNDCSPNTPDDTTSTWYVDCDSDTYASSNDGAMTTCEQPASPPEACPEGRWTPRAPTDAATTDCRDNDATINPAQSGWFTDPITGTRDNYDYNCMNGNEQRYPGLFPSLALRCSGSLRGCFGSSGWVSPDGMTRPVVPACGRMGRYQYCAYNRLTQNCSYVAIDRIQVCH